MSAPLVSALLLCVALTTDACLRREPSKPTTTTAAPPLSLSLSTFGTSLYKRLVSDNEDNIIFSPLSLYTALTMTLLGAGGDTEQELRTTLGVKPGQNVHSNLQTLMASMTRSDKAATLTLSIANALYHDPAQVIISDRYAAQMNSYYGSGLRTFQRPNPEEAINKWVEKVTQHEITNFLKPGTITYDTVLMLLNAVFFEGMWSSTFNPLLTEDNNFTTMSGAVKQVPMMYQQGYFSVKNDSELDALVLELPYKGDNYSLFIILPNTRNGLTDVESKLTGQILENALTTMPEEEPVMVFLPKFKVHMYKKMKRPLQDLGLNAMFDAARADFSSMGYEVGGRNLVVNEVLHEAVIEVTESGTKAAAATSVKIMFRSLFLPNVILKADHPFIFLLREKVHGINLFMGRFVDLTEAGQ